MFSRRRFLTTRGFLLGIVFIVMIVTVGKWVAVNAFILRVTFSPSEITFTQNGSLNAGFTVVCARSPRSFFVGRLARSGSALLMNI